MYQSFDYWLLLPIDLTIEARLINDYKKIYRILIGGLF